MIDERARLPMWTVYDHPRDFPDGFVARKFFTLPQVEATSQVMTSASLEDLRTTLFGWGLSCLARNDGDDPCIVETWL
jgi:hypothetical protein